MYGCDIRSGGTIYSATDGPGGPFLRGDHPRRDISTLYRGCNFEQDLEIIEH